MLMVANASSIFADRTQRCLAPANRAPNERFLRLTDKGLADLVERLSSFLVRHLLYRKEEGGWSIVLKVLSALNPSLPRCSPIDERNLEKVLKPLTEKEKDALEESLSCFGVEEVAGRRAVWLRLAMKDFVSTLIHLIQP